jgi:hypothetical protein
MEQETTFCAFCGKEIEYDSQLFASGKTGEPACNDCREMEKDVKANG